MHDGGVLDDAHKVGSQGRHLAEHNSTKGISQTDIAASECEVDVFAAQIKQLQLDLVHV